MTIALGGLLAALMASCASPETTGSGGTADLSSGSGGETRPATPIAPQTVFVLDSYGDGIADAPVVVNDAGGAVVAVHRTAIEGDVTVHVPPEGSVSVFLAYATSLSVSTVVDPPAGAAIRFPLWPADAKPGAPEVVTSYVVSFSDAPEETDSLIVDIDSGCDLGVAATAAQQAKISDRACAGSQTHRLLAVAVDEQYKVLKWSQVTVDADPGATVPVNITLINDTVSSATVEVVGVAGNAKVATSAGLTGGWWGGQSVSGQSPSNSTVSTLLTMADVPGLDRWLHAHVGIQEANAASNVSRSQRFSADELPEKWTFKADEMPWVLAEQVDTSVAEHPLFTWSAVEVERDDLLVLDSSWTVGVGSVSYEVRLPASHSPSWRMPDVPEELSGFRPHKSSSWKYASVAYFDMESVSGYAEAIAGFAREALYTSTIREGRVTTSP